MTTRIAIDNLQQSVVDTIVQDTVNQVVTLKISSIAIANSSYAILDDTAVDVNGGYIVITGTGFSSNCQVSIDGVNATSVSFVNSTTLRAQVGARTAGTYNVYVIDTNGDFAIRVNGLTYSSLPAWVTGSTLTGGQVDQFIAINLSATEANSYTVQAGSSLPPGLTLSANGYLFGTVTGLSSDTVYSFTIAAIDAELQDSPRTFNITITAGDTYFNLVTTLLSGDTTPNTFISDASTNNFELTPNGDVRANPFHPFNGGNYSNFFDGTGDYLTAPANVAFNFGSGDFTVECWVFLSSAPSSMPIIAWDTGTFKILRLNSTSLNFEANSPSNVSLTVSFASSLILNSWNHIALVRSGNSLFAYLNGVAGSSTSYTGNWGNSTDVLNIGYKSDPTYFSGHLSNLRIVKGTAVYTTNFTPSTTPLTAVANTSLLTCQSNRFIDNSTNNFTVTRNGDVTVDPFNPFIAIDSTTNGSGYFDGTGDSVTLPSSTPLSLTGDFTIEGWIWLDASNLTYPVLFASGNFYVRFGDAGFGYKLQAAIADVSVSTVYSCSITQSDVIKRWSHIAFTRQSGVNKLFFNGVQQNLNTGANPSTYPLSSWTDSTTVGGSTWEIGIRINGYVSNFRVIKGTALYTSSFTPSTTPLTAVANTSLLTLQTDIPVNNHTFVDFVRNGIVTRNGNTSQGTFSPYGENWSNYFDGSGDNLLTPYNAALNLTGDFTIECWFWANARGGMILNMGGGSGIAWASYELVNQSDGINFAGSSNNSGYDIGSETGATGRIGTITLNSWNHLAVTRSGNVYRGFVNGVQGYTQTLALTPYNTSTRGLSIGANYATTWGTGTPTSSVNGYIFDVRILKGTALYTSNFTPPTTPLQPIANTSILTCRDGSFVDRGPNNFAITRNGDVSVQKFSPFLTTTLSTPYYSNYFDGSVDFLTTPANSAFNLTGSSWTIEAFVYANTLTSSNTDGPGIIFVGDTTNNNGRIQLGFGTSGSVNFFMSNTSGTQNFSATSAAGSVVTNRWYHIAAVVNSSTASLFIDGVLTANSAITSTLSLSSNTATIGVRRASSLLHYWNGYISNLRIINGTALYTSNFTPPISPLTAVANTSLLTCRSNTLIDISNNNFAITSTGNTIPSLFSPFTVSYTTKQAYTPEVFGGSAYFDGSGDFLSIPSNPAFDIGSSDFTIECWFNSNSFASGQGLISRYNFTTVATGWALILNSSTVIRFIRGNDVLLDATVTAMNTRTWNHVAVVRSGSTIRTYLNGNQIAIATSVVNFTDATSALQIGRTNTVTNDMNGYISNVRVVKQALYTGNFVPSITPSTATANTSLLLNSTNAAIFDSSMKNNFETFGNARITNSIKKYGAGSIIMTGSGDYCRAVQNNLTNDINGSDFTIEFWVYFTSLAADRALVSKYGNAAENGGGLGYVLQWVQSTSSLRLVLGVGGGADNLYPWSWSPVTSTWYHVAVTRSGTSARAFINGTQIGTTTTVTTSDTVSPNPLQLGKTHTISQFLLGYIDDFRLTRGFARYTSNFTPPTKLIDK